MGLNCCRYQRLPPIEIIRDHSRLQRMRGENLASQVNSYLNQRQQMSYKFIDTPPPPPFDCRVDLRCVVVARLSTFIEQSVVTLCQSWGTERGRISLTPYQSAGCVLCCAPCWQIKWTVLKTNRGCWWLHRRAWPCVVRLAFAWRLVFSLSLWLSTWRKEWLEGTPFQTLWWCPMPHLCAQNE
jgi:hypothetical protein